MSRQDTPRYPAADPEDNFMKIRTLLGALALTPLVFAVPAEAGVEVGAEAPDFGAGDYFNIEPVKLSELAGRLVFLELFSTT